MRINIKEIFFSLILYLSSMVSGLIIVVVIVNVIFPWLIIYELGSPEMFFIFLPFPVFRKYSLPAKINYPPEMLKQVGVKFSFLGAILSTLTFLLFHYLFLKKEIKRKYLFLTMSLISFVSYLLFCYLFRDMFF